MSYDKHGDSCLCQVCIGAQGEGIGHTSMRVMRAILREWDRDKPSDFLTGETLAALAFSVGVHVELAHGSIPAVHALVEQGAQAARSRRPDKVTVDVVKGSEFAKLQQEEQRIKDEIRKGRG